MDEQDKPLSIARLKNRQKYYQEKALTLEKDFIFAQEQVDAAKLRAAEAEQEAARHKQKAAEAIEQAENLKQEIEVIRKELTEKAAIPAADAHQIEVFENLLKEMEQNIHAREEEVFVYKKRVKMLEKRLNLERSPLMNERPRLSQGKQSAKKQRALVYADYACMLKDRSKYQFRGSLYIENIGEEILGTPYVCFRFSPGDAAALKGQILSLEHQDPGQDPGRVQWQFMDSDWSKEAKERGEIWVHPIQKLEIKTGDQLVLPDFQIPVNAKYFDAITVEIFAYFQESDYRIRSLNQILINV